jgi:hypothetical protein
LVFMRCATYFPFDREKVFFSTAKLKERLLEGSHAEWTVLKLDKQSPLKQSKHPEVEGIEVSRNSSSRFLFMDFLQKGDLTEKNPKKIKITSKNCKINEIKYIDFPITIKKTLKDDFRTLIILPYHNMVEEYSKTIQAIVSEEEWYTILIATPKDDWLSFILCPKDDLGSHCQIFIHECAEPEVVDPKSRMNSGLAPFLLANPTNSLFIWLDPFQMKIFKDPNPHQVVKGPASTGKTILVQLKVLQILRRDPLTCKVIILLPFERLVDKFKLFFQNAGVETDGHNLLIATPNDPQLDEFIRTKNPHLFIDEYSAVIARKAQFSATLNNYLRNIPQSKYMWITVDIKQSLDAASEGNYLAEDLTKVSMKTEKHLLTVHRCVDNVFQQFRHHCDSNVQLGHQYKGSQGRVLLVQKPLILIFFLHYQLLHNKN